MKTNSPLNRLVGDMPMVGIRPTIDGRLGGVREALEKTTRDMAENVARLIESTLRHSNGLPVECVIADSCIGGVAEAAATAEKFRKAGVGVSLTVTPCWCYGSETMDMDASIPKAIWGFNGTERPGAVYLAAVSAGHTQKGLPAFTIYGRDVQDIGSTEIPADVRGKILSFVKAGLAVATMRGKSYLSVGGVSMGIAGSIVNQDFFEDSLGMRVVCVDMTEIVRRIEEKICDEAEFKRALAWVKQNWFVPTLTGQGVFRDVYSVMNAWGANHGTISYGHIGAELITLAGMLRIPVYMHNVAEEKVFRPSAWTAFGTADLEGADFRACANFGPLYGKTR